MILLAAVVVTVIVAAFVGALVHFTTSEQRDQTLAEQELRAFYAADAGLTAAVSEINTGVDTDGDGLGTVAGTIGDETFAVLATPTGTGAYELSSAGIAATARRTIRQVVDVAPGPFRGAFLSEGPLALSGVTIDSYNSDVGNYAGQVVGFSEEIGREFANANGDVGSFTSIDVSGSTGVLGNLRMSPSGSVTYGGGSWYVSGQTLPFADPPTLEAVVYDPPDIPSVNVNLNGSDTMALSDGTYRLSEIDLAGQSELTLSGDVTIYLDGDFDISGGASLVIAPGADVTIYQGDGTVSITGNGVVNQTTISSSLQWLSASTQQFSMSGTASFHGAIYAPRAPVVVSGVVEGYGSVVGATVDAGGSSVWHYDEALRKTQPFEEPRFEPLLWGAP